MTNEAKRRCIEDIVELYKNDTEIEDVQIADVDGNAEMTCRIHGMNVTFLMKRDSDMLTFKASKIYQEYTERELTEFGESFIKERNDNINVMCFGSRIEFSAPLILAGFADSVAMDMVKERANTFFAFLKDVTKKLDKSLAEANLESNPLHALLMKEGIQYQQNGFLTTTYIDANDLPLELLYHSGSHMLTVRGIVEADVATRENEGKVVSVCEENGVQFRLEASGVQIIQESKAETEREIEVKIDEFLLYYGQIKSKIEEVLPQENLGIFTTSEAVNKINSDELDDENSEKEVNSDIKEDKVNDSEAENPLADKANDNQDNREVTLTSEIPETLEETNDTEEKENIQMEEPVFKYQQAPSVEKQMIEMLNEMNQTFKTRKELLDFRDNTLKRKEEVFLQEKRDFESLKDQVNAEKEKLSNSWNNYHEKRKTLEEKENVLKEREEELDKRGDGLKRTQQSFYDRSNNLTKKEQEVSQMLADAKELERSAADMQKASEELDRTSSQRMEEISIKESQLALKQAQVEEEIQTLNELKRMVEEGGYTKPDGREIEDLQNLLNAKDMKLSELSSELDALRNNNEKANLAQELEECKENLTKKERDYEVCLVQKEELLKELDKAKEALQEKDTLLQSTNNANGNEEISRLTEECNRIKEELGQKENVIHDLEERLSQKDSESRQQETEDVTTYADRLKEIGLEAKPLDGEDVSVLSLNFRSINFFFREGVNVLYAEKKVKKGFKYADRANKLNAKDWNTTYVCEYNKIICKKIITDLKSDLVEVAEAIGSLK